MTLSKGILISIQVLLFLLIPTALVHFNTVKHPNAGLNVIQLITKFGYAVETHNVLTEDGYILTLHRIPQKNFKTTKKNLSTPVLLYHGMYNSAAEYICMGPGKALGLLLADNNYDVWLGNYRGTTWSRNHTKLDPDKDKDEFWNFTFDEMGLYDLPASIDYILNKTRKSDLNYIGYSQSASTALIMLSERPEYLKKIKFVSLLSPAVFMKNSQSPGLVLGASIQNLLKMFFLNTGNQEFASSRGLVGSFFRASCNNKNSFLFYFCKGFTYVMQQNMGCTDEDDFSVIGTNLPAGISILQQINLLQYLRSGKFVKFDWGKEANLVRYGQAKPPAYDLSKITTPIAIYYFKNDKVINEVDVRQLIKSLPNVVKDSFIHHETFNHLDFVVGANATEILYYLILEELEKY